MELQEAVHLGVLRRAVLAVRVEDSRTPPGREDKGFPSFRVLGISGRVDNRGMRDGRRGLEGAGEGCRWGGGVLSAAGGSR